MILKIKDAEASKKWWYKDNITSITFNYNDYTVTSDHKIFDKEEEIKFGRLDAWLVKYPEKEDEKIVVAILMKDDDEMCIAFNTEAYLLNDEGKTIERIS